MRKFTDHQLKTILITGILALTLVAAGSALAQGPGKGQGQGQGMMGRGMGPGNHPGFDQGFGSRGEFRLERMAARLGLTDEQAEAIEKIREDGRKGNLELRKQTMRLRNELRGEMLKDDPSQKTVLDLNAKLGDLRTEKQANRLKNRLAVREQLTPDQRDQMLMMDKSGKGNRDGRHGFHEGRRGQGQGQGQGQGRGFRGNSYCPNFNR